MKIFLTKICCAGVGDFHNSKLGNYRNKGYETAPSDDPWRIPRHSN